MALSVLRLLHSEDSITKRLDSISNELNKHYYGKDVVMVCVLKGAFMFFADIVRRCQFTPAVDFMRIASYRDALSPSDLTLYKEVEVTLQNKHVLIVEDIVDTGHSLTFLQRYFMDKKVLTVATLALLNKTARREVDVTVEYSCFTMEEDFFVVGYGLDYNEQYRELPALYSLTG